MRSIPEKVSFYSISNEKEHISKTECMHCGTAFVYEPEHSLSMTQWVACSACQRGTIAPAQRGLREMR